jgi:hypothetical protein
MAIAYGFKDFFQGRDDATKMEQYLFDQEQKQALNEQRILQSRAETDLINTTQANKAAALNAGYKLQTEQVPYLLSDIERKDALAKAGHQGALDLTGLKSKYNSALTVGLDPDGLADNAIRSIRTRATTARDKDLLNSATAAGDLQDSDLTVLGNRMDRVNSLTGATLAHELSPQVRQFKRAELNQKIAESTSALTDVSTKQLIAKETASYIADDELLSDPTALKAAADVAGMEPEEFRKVVFERLEKRRRRLLLITGKAKEEAASRENSLGGVPSSAKDSPIMGRTPGFGRVDPSSITDDKGRVDPSSTTGGKGPLPPGADANVLGLNLLQAP